MTQVLKHRDGAGPGEFLASPLPFLWLPYRLVAWDHDDRILLVTSSTYDSLWVMARDAVPPPEAYQRAVDKAKSLGFDVARLEKAP
jgi:lipocalin